jgi:hypothetical protein
MDVLGGTVEIDVIQSEIGESWWKMTGNVKFGDLDFESYVEDGEVDCDVKIEGIHDNDEILEDDSRIAGLSSSGKIGILSRGNDERVLVIEVGAIEAQIFKLICPST